jgi:NAD(P)-dependent dehydrogenase (short-subunit alcohol dehydrogenase family)
VTDYRKLFDLSGKSAVVLGAASGIGKFSAEALASLGACVLCADRDADGAEATAMGILKKGGSASAAVCDAASGSGVAALARTARAKFPTIDIAVTTPGLNIRKTILDYTEEDLDRVINLNIKGTLWFFQAFGRIMVEQKGGSLLVHARGDDRAGTCGLRLDQGRDRLAGEGLCVGSRKRRRSR